MSDAGAVGKLIEAVEALRPIIERAEGCPVGHGACLCDSSEDCVMSAIFDALPAAQADLARATSDVAVSPVVGASPVLDGGHSRADLARGECRAVLEAIQACAKSEADIEADWYVIASRALAVIPTPSPAPSVEAATYATEHARLVQEVGECCRGTDPYCMGTECLVVMALRKRGVPRLSAEVWQAHRPATNDEQQPGTRYIAGYCVRCSTPWPCKWSPESKVALFPRAAGDADQMREAAAQEIELEAGRRDYGARALERRGDDMFASIEHAKAAALRDVAARVRALTRPEGAA